MTHATEIRTAVAASIVGAAALAAGCGGESASGETPTLALGAEEVRIGSLDDPEAALTEVAHVFVTPWNQVLVAQPQDGTVRAHDARTGRLIRRLGRPGDGPGEFRNPNWIGRLGDTVWVNDGSLRRLTWYDSEGNHLGDRRYPDPPEVASPLTTGFGMLTEAGTALFVTNSSDPEAPLPVIVRDRDGRTMQIGVRTGLPRFAGVSTAGDGWARQLQRFWTRTTWSPDPQGSSLAFAERPAADGPERSTYHVARVAVAGDTLFARDVPYDPIPIPRAVLDSLPESTPEEYRPEYYPPVSGVVAGSDGTTWVAREETLSEARRWDVFDADGGLVGVLEAPTGFEIFDASLERLWAVTQDELDVPYVVRVPVLGGGG